MNEEACKKVDEANDHGTSHMKVVVTKIPKILDYELSIIFVETMVL
jgi:hypothetical protein